MRYDYEKMAIKKHVLWGLIGLLSIIALIISFSMFKNVPAGSICVIQSPISGKLDVHFEPGVKLRWFGSVTMYPREGIYEFLSPVDPDDETESKKYRAQDDRSIKIQFNDSGAGWISGSMRYAYPLTTDEMVELHKKFQGHNNVVNGLIKPNIERVINMTGPLMSSIESSRTRRAEIPFFIEDQVQNGLYFTVTKDERVQDEITKQYSTVKVAAIQYDDEGNAKRQGSSIVSDMGMRVYNINMNKLNYEKKVLARLDDLFKADSEKQIAYMKASKAEQDAKTAEEEGKARQKAAEWAAKEITATQTEAADREKQVAVIEAEKAKETALIEATRNKEVAELDKQTAALYRDALNLRTDADVNRKRRLMEADGALEAKLSTYEKVMANAYNAIATYQGAWVPSIVTGSNGESNNAALNMMEFLSIKAAKDLGLNMNIK